MMEQSQTYIVGLNKCLLRYLLETFRERELSGIMPIHVE